MHILKLGNKPRLAIENRVTGGGQPDSPLVYHRHLVIFGWHICPLKKRTDLTSPLALFGTLCRAFKNTKLDYRDSI